MSEEVNPFKDISFREDSDEEPDIWDWVSSPEFDEAIKDPFDRIPTTENVLKVFNIAGEAFLSNPRIFRTLFIKMINDVKLNTKIRKKYNTKEEIHNVYRAIRFFDKMVRKKEGYDHAYKESSKYWGVPEKYLRSIVATRNALKRNKLKI